MKITNIFCYLAVGTAMTVYEMDNSIEENAVNDPCAFAFKAGPVSSPEHMRFLMNSPRWPACQAKIDAEAKANTQKFLNGLALRKEKCERENSQSEECQMVQEYSHLQAST